MSWFFEIESGVGLTDTVMSGLSPGEGDIDGGFDSFIEQMKKTNGDPDVSPLNSYDTMVVVPEDPGPQDPPPPEDPTEPPLQPPTRPEPLSPSGPPVDYTGLITVAEILSWLEWIGNYGPSTHMGGGNYDSLAEYMNGEWHFDVDPELIDTGGFYGEHGQGGYVNYDQFGTTNRLVGFGAASGMLTPVFREWNEIVPVPPGEGDNVHGWEVIHHTEFLGFRSSATYRVTSLSDPQDWLGRLEGLMDGVDIAQAYAQLLAAAEGDPNTFAMGQPFISQANGMLMAEVSLNGVFIGHVQVNDNGFRLFDINGNLIGSELPLTQHWNEIGGVSYMEYRAHQERTMNIPFAQALVGLGTVFTGGMMSFLGGLGFGLASGVVTGGSAANATAYARLLEAAYELRRFELRNR